MEEMLGGQDFVTEAGRCALLLVIAQNTGSAYCSAIAKRVKVKLLGCRDLMTFVGVFRSDTIDIWSWSRFWAGKLKCRDYARMQPSEAVDLSSPSDRNHYLSICRAATMWDEQTHAGDISGSESVSLFGLADGHSWQTVAQGEVNFQFWLRNARKYSPAHCIRYILHL